MVYSLVALALVLLLNYLTNSILNNAFPSIDTLLEHRDKLERDDFSNIPYWKFKNCEFIVYDDQNQVIYSTESDLQEKLKPGDTDLIQEYSYTQFFEVLQRIDENGRIFYEIYCYQYNVETEEYEVDDYCVVDANYKIIEGDLFSGREYLSQKDFDLIRGNYENNKEIIKYQYKTSMNEERTLIFVFPKFSINDYNKTVEATNRLWFVFVLVLFVIIIVQSFLFSRRIKHSLKPLDAAIVSYGSEKHSNISRDEVPMEFRHIVDDFENLLKRLDQAKEEKEHEEQERYRMLANISHDLNTPLTAIQGYSKAFCDGIVQPEKKDLYMKTIYHKSMACSELMDTFFEFTKLQHPDFIPNLETVDLAEFIREYLGEKYVEFELKDFHMEPDIPEKTILCKVDCKLLRRALDNLTANALKYNPKGTTVLYSLRDEKEMIYLTIADDGIGIPREIRKEVFEPFITGNSARTTDSGTGFGMTITRKIVELHGGTIRLLDTPRSGYSTEFEILLHKCDRQ